MRELIALHEPGMRERIRANIPRSDRFRPEPRLVRKIGLTPLDDGFAEMDVKIPGAPRRVHPMLVSLYRGLEEGATFQALVERATPLCPKPSPKLVEKLLRSYLLKLHEAGVVELDFEPPPATFHGRYERVRELGRGGMGVVHLCRDRENGGAPVVLKHAWGWSTAIEKAELTNRREAAALAILDHPLVPKLVDTFEEGGILHMVRAYADGEPMTKAVRRLAQATSVERLTLAADIAEALAHVHERGMLYLDTKPDNFIIDAKTRRPILLDMGLCRPMTDGAIHVRAPIGSRGYAALEMLRERVATVRSDVYGLGRTMAVLATGKKVRPRVNGDGLAPLLLDHGVDPREAALVARFAADDPAARPADMREAAHEVHALLEALGSEERAHGRE